MASKELFSSTSFMLLLAYSRLTCTPGTLLGLLQALPSMAQVVKHAFIHPRHVGNGGRHAWCCSISVLTVL